MKISKQGPTLDKGTGEHPKPPDPRGLVGIHWVLNYNNNIGDVMPDCCGHENWGRRVRCCHPFCPSMTLVASTEPLDMSLWRRDDMCFWTFFISSYFQLSITSMRM